MDTIPLIALQKIAGNPPTHLYPLQQWALPHLHALVIAWLSVWCCTALVLLARVFRDYRARASV